MMQALNFVRLKWHFPCFPGCNRPAVMALRRADPCLEHSIALVSHLTLARGLNTQRAAEKVWTVAVKPSSFATATQRLQIDNRQPSRSHDSVREVGSNPIFKAKCKIRYWIVQTLMEKTFSQWNTQDIYLCRHCVPLCPQLRAESRHAARWTGHRSHRSFPPLRGKLNTGCLSVPWLLSSRKTKQNENDVTHSLLAQRTSFSLKRNEF